MIHELKLNVAGVSARDITDRARAIGEVYFACPVDLRIYAEGEADELGRWRSPFQATVTIKPQSLTGNYLAFLEDSPQ